MEGKKKIKGENGGKMTRYGVCLILKRGEVSLPGGLQQWMSWHWCIFFSSLLVIASVFSVTQGLQRHQQGPASPGMSCDRWLCLSERMEGSAEFTAVMETLPCLAP